MVPRQTEIRNEDIPSPLLDSILPSMLYLRVVSILDEALEFYLDDHAIPWPPRTKKDFYHRIDVLADSGILKNKAECHRIREMRNKLAHETGEFTTWDALHKCVDSVELELQNLGFIGVRPKYAWYSTVSSESNSSDNNFTLSYGLMDLGGQKVIEVTWKEPAANR